MVFLAIRRQRGPFGVGHAIIRKALGEILHAVREARLYGIEDLAKDNISIANTGNGSNAG